MDVEAGKTDGKRESIGGVSSSSNIPGNVSGLADVLTYAEVLIKCRFTEGGILPPFSGPTIRGGFGHHLKRTVCHCRATSCQDCIVRPTCVYSYVFEGVAPPDRKFMRLYNNIPQPFVLDVDMNMPGQVRAGDRFEIGLKLFAGAIKYFPYILYSLIELGKAGLGKERVRFTVRKVLEPESGTVVFTAGDNSVIPLQENRFKLNTYSGCDQINVGFLTPSKFRVKGKDAVEIDFVGLIKAALRRVSILSNFYGEPLENAVDTSKLLAKSSEITLVRDDTRLFSFSRYSGRQKRPIKMGGLLGEMTFSGKLEEYIPLLKLTEIIHVGKSTSFGFGKIRVKCL